VQTMKMDEVNVSELSDSDLRKKLISFGASVGPITSTTRGILEKKLRKFLQGATTAATNGVSEPTPPEKEKSKSSRRSSAGRRSSRKFAPISSDEEDFNGVGDNESKKTVPNNVSVPKSTPVLKPVNNDFVDPNDVLIPPAAKNSPLTSVKQRATSRRSFNNSTTVNNVTSTALKPLQNEFSDDELPTSEPQATRIPSRTSEGLVPHGSSGSSSSGVPAGVLNGHDSSISNSQPNTNYNTANRVNHVTPSQPYLAHSSTSSLKSITPTRNIPSVSSLRNTSTASPAALRSTSPARASTTMSASKELPADITDELNTSLKELRRTYASKRPSPNRLNKRYQQRIPEDTEEEESEEEDETEVGRSWRSYLRLIWDTLMSWRTLVVLAVVFALLALYLQSRSPNHIPSIAADAATVDTSPVDHYHIVNCLYQKLSVLAGDAECGDAPTRWVKMSDLQEFALPCVQEGDTTFEVIKENIRTTYAEFFAVNDSDEVSSRYVHRSLKCRINQAVSIVMLRVIAIILIVSAIIAGYFYKKNEWSRYEEETRQMLSFSAQIIEMLKKHQEALEEDASLRPFIPIMHARDNLIALDKRNDSTLMQAWNKAVASVNCDSRIRLVSERVSGEDMDCWRWIAVVGAPKMKKAKKATTAEMYLSNDQEKCWLGPAFDQLDKVVRMPIVTPTPCLKIRYMHEGSEEKADAWVKQVENAVLEKCSKVDARILHLYVDKTSKEGCVYVKCDSLESAGKAFRSMYGNWFDSRLVIVKYITLARYHQRFPDALTCTVPLRHDEGAPTSLNCVTEDA